VAACIIAVAMAGQFRGNETENRKTTTPHKGEKKLGRTVARNQGHALDLNASMDIFWKSVTESGLEIKCFAHLD
jgi:hypothetical protein